jgi:hypothetical protein
MSSIVINPKNDSELNFISELLQKLGVDSKVLTDEELEDLGLSILMKEVDRSEVVSEEEIMSKLQA